MHTVISILKLLAFFGGGLVFLVGLGWLVAGPILHGSLRSRNRGTSLIQDLPVALVCGLMVNYGLVLCFQQLRLSFIVGGILSLIGAYFFVSSLRSQLKTEKPSRFGSPEQWIGISFVGLLFLSPILADPLEEWDARSIWFFHAKMIYTAGSIGQSAGWSDPVILFSHPDYPNLVPSLAAQTAFLANFWNEYVPKAALFFVLLPALCWLFSFARRSFSFAILVLLFPLSFYPHLWNGMMDGYLAIYFSIAMLLLGRYVLYSDSTDLIASVCCLFLLLYIKNEGSLAALIGFVVALFTYSLKNKTNPSLSTGGWRYLLPALIGLLPFFLWTFYKQSWNVSNDLEIGTMQSFARIANRLKDGSYTLIIQNSYKQVESALLMLGLLYSASVAWRRPLPTAALPAFLAAGVYAFGMMLVYLLTPADLAWHLESSIDRTMLSVTGGILIGCYFVLSSLEGDPQRLDSR